jgi:hypothetical protein
VSASDDATGRPVARTARSSDDTQFTGVLSVEFLEAHTDQAFEGTTLVSRARSLVQGLEIAGVVRIDTIEARSITRTDGRNLAETDARLIVSGISVEDQTIGISDDGITIAGVVRLTAPALSFGPHSVGAHLSVSGLSSTGAGGCWALMNDTPTSPRIAPPAEQGFEASSVRGSVTRRASP